MKHKTRLNDDDYDDADYERKENDLWHSTGCYGLWLAVTLSAILSLINGKHRIRAESFLFDEDNSFFDYVAERNDMTPEKMRERIIKLPLPQRCVNGKKNIKKRLWNRCHKLLRKVKLR